MLHDLQTHSLPREGRELARLGRRMGIMAPLAEAAREFRARHARLTGAVHRAFREFFAAPPRRRAAPARVPGLIALRATGFADPERARQNLRLLLEGRPLVPYPAATGAAMARLVPAVLDAVWQSPDPDEALNQFERFVAAMGPRTGYLELLATNRDVLTNLIQLCARGEVLAQLLVSQPELLTSLAASRTLSAVKREPAFRAALAPALAPARPAAEVRDRLRRTKQAEELGIVWRYLLGVTSLEQYSREITALAEAALAVGWLRAKMEQGERSPIPPVPAVIIGMGKLGGRELTTGSDLDLFVVYGGESDRAHEFYAGAVERLSSLLGDITAAGVVFPVDLRLRPGSKGSGFASSVDALSRYYQEYGDLWERQSLTRARICGGDSPALARRVRAELRQLVYGAPLPRTGLKEILDVRRRMEVELGRETPGRYHVKYGRGGLTDVEFLVQALQLLHGATHPGIRRANTLAALAALARHGLLEPALARALAGHYRMLRGVSVALRLFGARPTDTLDVAGPLPARVARSLDYASRDAFLTDYRRRTEAIRQAFERTLRA
jgi:glutamate-ammonia-ligase adenylyltransferase